MFNGFMILLNCIYNAVLCVGGAGDRGNAAAVEALEIVVLSGVCVCACVCVCVCVLACMCVRALGEGCD